MSARENIEQIKKQLSVESDNLFKECVAALFSVEGIEAVAWEQYIPYFNDGAACVFHVCEARILVSPRDADVDEEDTDSWDYAPESVAHEEALRAFDKDLSSIEDYLSEKFGQHSQVVIRKGQEPEVSEYDHD